MTEYARPLTPYLRLAFSGAGVYTAYVAIGALQAWIGTPVFAAVNFLLFLAAAILGGIWFGRIGSNLDRLDRGDRTWSTALGVVVWYIPLVNLVLPYFAVKEMVRASQPGDDWRNHEVPAYVTRWWLLWAGAGLVVVIGTVIGIAAGAGAVLEAGDNETAQMEALDQAEEDNATLDAILSTISALLVAASLPLYLRLCRDLAAWHDAQIQARYV
ncbi:MAG: DUF4328 domain-containing protein [Thermoplasmatota archaeon]